LYANTCNENFQFLITAAIGFHLQNEASEYVTLKVINYIRAEIAAGRDPRPLQTSHSPKTSAPWSDDSFLCPILANDELLLHDWAAEQPSLETTAETVDCEEENMAAMFEDMKQLAMSDPAVRDLLLAASGGPTGAEMSSKHDAQIDIPCSDDDADEISGSDTAAKAAASNAAAIDATYFESYSFFDIHRFMLSDRVRTSAYRDALEKNPDLLRGATVLDVGCGTGVLSMFAARAGAEKIFAVDGSPEIAQIARKICAANGYGGEVGVDNKITVISSKIEALDELPTGDDTSEKIEQVDVLVSEWMGYALLFESMLDSVLIARDTYLKPGGAILPDIANIYIAAADSGACDVDFWRDVYGFNMSIVSDSLRQAALREAAVRVVQPQDLMSESQQLVSFDLATMKRSDQDFTSEFILESSAGPRTCAALVLWFDTLFSKRYCKEAPQELPTGPWDIPTHWTQTVLELSVPIEMAPAAAGVSGAAVALKGRLSMARRSERHRTLDISLEYAPVMADKSVGETRVQLYSMGVGANK